MHCCCRGAAGELKSESAPADLPMKIMISITRLFRLGIRLTAWATPRVKEWHRERQLNFTEGHRNLETRNWTEAEKHLALAFAERRSRSGKQRVELLLGLAKAQRHQHKLVEAEHTAHQAIDVAAKARDHSGRLLAMEALVDVQLEQIKYAEAEQTIKEIQRLEESRPKPDHALLARCSRKLAGALLKSSRQAEAMEAFQRSVPICRSRVSGPTIRRLQVPWRSWARCTGNKAIRSRRNAVYAAHYRFIEPRWARTLTKPLRISICWQPRLRNQAISPARWASMSGYSRSVRDRSAPIAKTLRRRKCVWRFCISRRNEPARPVNCSRMLLARSNARVANVWPSRWEPWPSPKSTPADRQKPSVGDRRLLK